MVTGLDILKAMAEATEPRAAGPLGRLPAPARALLPCCRSSGRP